MKGRIHSVESCGTLDGPGIRYVVFTQGCLMRCQYCHNPDTWDLQGGKEVTVEEILSDLRGYAPYLHFSGGGITVSGGEPLIQLPFLIQLFKACKSEGIHTCLDTSGGCFTGTKEQYKLIDQLLKVTDLVMLDIKQIDNEKHRRLTGVPNLNILKLAQYLSDNKVSMWIRYVLVPGHTDDEQDIKNLGEFIRGLSSVEKVEVLPYHKLGVYKWKELGLKYMLEDVQPPSEELVEKAYQLLSPDL